MKSYGILFTPDLIVKCERDEKTVTRRVIAHQGFLNQFSDHNLRFRLNKEKRCYEVINLRSVERGLPIKLFKARYGIDGDVIYIKQGYAFLGDRVLLDNERAKYQNLDWKSKLFMKRDYARIHLKNLGPRIERLQQITVAEAYKEGVSLSIKPIDAIEEFRKLWNSIYAPWKAVMETIEVLIDDLGTVRKNRVISHYVSYPFTESDTPPIPPKMARVKHIAFPNPWVEVVPFKLDSIRESAVYKSSLTSNDSK